MSFESNKSCFLCFQIQSFRRNMLRLIGLGEFNDLATWKDTVQTYVLNEVICKACNQCRDIDLCKDRDRATVNDMYVFFEILISNKRFGWLMLSFFVCSPVWLCSQCYVYYENEEIEVRLLDVLQRKIMSYTLQDLRCTRCKEIKRDNVAALCSCAGTFDTLINADDLRQLLKTFETVAENHQMNLLKDQVQVFLANSI